MLTFLRALVGDLPDRGDAVRAWLREGRRVTWAGPHSLPRDGRTHALGFSDSLGQAYIDLSAEELAVCADFACQIGHPDSEILAKLVVS